VDVDLIGRVCVGLGGTYDCRCGILYVPMWHKLRVLVRILGVVLRHGSNFISTSVVQFCL